MTLSEYLQVLQVVPFGPVRRLIGPAQPIGLCHQLGPPELGTTSLSTTSDWLGPAEWLLSPARSAGARYDKREHLAWHGVRVRRPCVSGVDASRSEPWVNLNYVLI